MNEIIEIFKYILPSAIVLAATYLIIKQFFDRDREKNLFHIKQENVKTITPIRLQAYERLVLFLERISPGSLVMRIHKPSMSANQLHHELIKAIREEFEHNLSQQVYMSSKAWEKVKVAKEDIIKTINTASGKLNDNATSTELSQKIFELSISNDKQLTQEAIEYLKNEIRKIFY